MYVDGEVEDEEEEVFDDFKSVLDRGVGGPTLQPARRMEELSDMVDKLFKGLKVSINES